MILLAPRNDVIRLLSRNDGMQGRDASAA